MLKRTARGTQEQEQEAGFRRVMRTFDPEVPGYVFWPIIFGVSVIFQIWCSAASSGARRLSPRLLSPRESSCPCRGAAINLISASAPIG